MLGTLDTVLDFAYLNNYLLTKETAWKRGDTIFFNQNWYEVTNYKYQKNYKYLMLQIDPLLWDCKWTHSPTNSGVAASTFMHLA